MLTTKSPSGKRRRYTLHLKLMGGLWHFTRVPFGLSNSALAFQRVINTIISDSNLIGTFVYLDDVLIDGSSQEEHDLNLERFRETAVNYNPTLN